MLIAGEDCTDNKARKAARRFSCANNTSGFALALHACFARDDLDAENYEDLVEQELSRLQSHAKLFYCGYKHYVKLETEKAGIAMTSPETLALR